MTDISDLSELKSLNQDEMRIWIKKFLLGDALPLHIFDLDRPQYDLLILLIRDLLPIDEIVLAQNIKTGLTSCISTFSYKQPEYFDLFWDMITVASRVRADGLKNELIPIMNKGLFKGKSGRGEDLHYCIIDALANLGLTVRETYCLYTRDINDPRYVDVAYKSIYGADLGSWINYMPKVIKVVGTGIDSAELMGSIIEDLLDVIGPDCALTELTSLLNKLDSTTLDLSVFIGALLEAFDRKFVSSMPIFVDLLSRLDFVSIQLNMQKDLNMTGSSPVTVMKKNTTLVSIVPSFARYVKRNQTRTFQNMSWSKDFRETLPIVKQIRNNETETEDIFEVLERKNGFQPTKPS